ncbi:transcriptional regulator [uncultured Brevundimonas sp.]|uniref:winged helix-turn-helix domain-containing protein n=1 Tax=uncultured Brevundimonas sp. TaxID=213418 RepID=UPI0030ED6CCB|tara:strand:- start:574 stop:879 length:306 start_codon:yes stop_codon:yes gene_type:complete
MSISDLGRIDDLIHGRMRLGIMVYLSDAGSAEFTRLKTVLATTQGNLSMHLKKLEAAGYVAVVRRFQDNRPLTRVTITDRGRSAFGAYLEALAGLIGGGSQ